MTIALSGAIGKTGKHFLAGALEKGFSVRALVRTPEKVSIESEPLTIIKGDLLNVDDVHRTIKNADAVFSLAGHVKGSPSDFQTKSSRFIVDAMKSHGVNRLITLTGGGVRDGKNDNPGFMDQLIVFIMKHLAGKGSRNALLDGREHIAFLRQQEGLDLTVVRGPKLTNDPATGHIEVGQVGTIPGFKLTRADLAKICGKDALCHKRKIA